MQFPSRPARPWAMTMAPLIDVVFLMLIFFLLTSSFVRYRVLDLTFVDTRLVESGRPERLLVVRLTESGSLTVDGEPTDINGLESVIAARLAENPLLAGVVLPAESVPLQSTVTVLERVIAGGLTNVRIGEVPADDL